MWFPILFTLFIIVVPIGLFVFSIKALEEMTTPRNKCGCKYGQKMTKRCEKTGLHPRRVVNGQVIWE